MEKMSVCKVGATLFLPSPSFTPLDQPMYFLTLQTQYMAGRGNPQGPYIDSSPISVGLTTLKGKYVQTCFQITPSGSASVSWMHLGSLGTFNTEITSDIL